MIARVWSAQTTPARAPDYVKYLTKKVLPLLRGLDGYGGTTLLERAVPDGVEVVVITYWQSIEALRGFTGEDVEGAVVANEAAALLTRFEERARHYEVTLKEMP